MDKYKEVFLKAVSFAVKGEQMTDDPCLSEAEWIALLNLAAEQEILPLTFEAVMSCRSFSSVNGEIRRKFKDAAVTLSIRQVMQTNEFLTLLMHLRQKGMEPAVLKGIVVRRLYPKPVLRPSVDEDILIDPKDAGKIHKLLIEEGLTPDSEYESFENAGDLSYHRIGTPTYIEVHTSMFPKGSEAYSDLNALFDKAEDRLVEIEEEDVSFKTLSAEDHLLYLLLHAYKHFLHSGMGLRHVCDICIFAEKMNVDGRRIREICDEMGLSHLFAAVFEIGRRYLGLNGYPAFDDIEADPEPLLADMLSGGLYGVEDVNRAHSSTLTLEAVASHKKGRRSRGALHSVFLPKGDLEGRYPYLKKHGWLLPVAWAQRGISYLRSRKNNPVSPSESLRIGRERVELLRKYGIID